MNKKAQLSGIAIIGIIVGIIIFILGLLILFALVLQDGKKEEVEETGIGNIKLYLKSFSGTEQIISDYKIFDENSTQRVQGSTNSDSWTETNINLENMQVLCSAENYYSSLNPHSVSGIEKTLNSSKFECNLEAPSNLIINHSGTLGGESEISILVNSEKKFQKISAIVRWTGGIINAQFKESEIICGSEYGNFTNFRVKSLWKNSTLMTNGYYCGSSLYVCDSFSEEEISRNQSNFRCVHNEPVPLRFSQGAKSVFYPQVDLNNETRTFVLSTRSAEDINADDYVEVIFYDGDLRFDGTKFSYLSEENSKNLANEDFSYRIFKT